MSVAENASMEVTFSFTREDYLHYIDYWLKRNRRAHRRWLLQRSGLLFGALLILSLSWNVPAAVAVGVALLCAGFATWSLRRNQVRRYRRMREDVLGARTVRIGPEGV